MKTKTQEVLSKDCVDTLKRIDTDLRHAAYARMSRRATEAGLYDKFFERMKDSGSNLAHDYCFLADLAFSRTANLRKSIDTAYHALIRYHREER